MGILSWLFPTDEDRLRRARARMAKGQWEDARRDLLHCKAPEAEALYDECSRAIDKGEAATIKKRLAGDGFHGWKVVVDAKNARLKAELERLVTEEMEKAGVDLGLPDIDEDALKPAMARAQRRVKSSARENVAVRLVPVVSGELAERMKQQQR
jgi:hypothetical protein